MVPIDAYGVVWLITAQNCAERAWLLEPQMQAWRIARRIQSELESVRFEMRWARLARRREIH